MNLGELCLPQEGKSRKRNLKSDLTSTDFVNSVSDLSLSFNPLGLPTSSLYNFSVSGSFPNKFILKEDVLEFYLFAAIYE